MSIDLSKLFKFNQTGQAALMDSIFFLTIVSTIGVALFYFYIHYGEQTNTLITSFYSQDFSSDVLKVISYSSALRGGEDLTKFQGSNPELDYLFALIKEDFSNNQKNLSDGTIFAIARTVSVILKPFDNSFDYAFYINSPDSSNDKSNYYFFLVANHEIVDSTVSRNYYSCIVNQTNAEKHLFSKVGKIDSSIAKLSLTKKDGDKTTNFVYDVVLNIWINRNIDLFKSKSEYYLYQSDPLLAGNSGFDCNKIDLESDVPAFYEK
ncbi:MAG: hypothetical protein PHQ98_02560 [Candidatus ainarchaeum sp.]|nr:hypothetical protein [Candidatus ainarchaeum sp.]